jgi:outer membrane protein assembly factor BamB
MQPLQVSTSRFVLLVLATALTATAADWPSWRGPASTGVSADTQLPSSWSPEGENLLWKAEVGSRATPVVVKGLVCTIRLAEPDTPAKWQEQVFCLDENTGQLRWERRQNVFQTDIPHHRVGWASLVADPESGTLYSQSISGVVTAYRPDGTVLWVRALDEEIGRFSGFGGRTTTPVADGDMVVVTFLTAGFGPNAVPRHRFYALDRATGETIWISTPGDAPQDTTYSTPIVRVIGGQRLLIAGNGDGGIYALKMGTGEKVWGFPLSKRGINTSVVESGGIIFASHSEENVDESTNMGRLVALDANTITEGKPKLLWMVDGFGGGYSSPIIDGGILYQVDNSANLIAFDAKNGERLWLHNLGIAQKASPVIADGKLYVSDVDGQFHILKLNGRTPPERLDLDTFKNPDGSLTQINGSPAIANGRIFFPTEDMLYCIGTANGKSMPPVTIPGPVENAPPDAAPAFLQVMPSEVALRPGAQQHFSARLFDAQGRFIRQTDAEWTLAGINGQLDAGHLALTNENVPQGGTVTAKAAGLTGVSQVRVMPTIGYTETFNSYPVQGIVAGSPAMRGRYAVVEKDGEKVLYKDATNIRSQKTSVYLSPSSDQKYEVQVDVFASEKARRMPDVGLVSHRYTLDLQGNKQRMMVRTWTSEPERFSEQVSFKFDPNVWYRLRFRVEPSEENGPTRVMAKAWKRDEPEPEAWTIDVVDPIGNAHGSAGIYGFALADIYYDDWKVLPLQ